MEEEIHNANMARYRIAVEWGFGRIANLFALTDYKLKLGLSPIGDWNFTAILMANAHTCYYGSQTSDYFQCPPPSIREYFGVDSDR